MADNGSDPHAPVLVVGMGRFGISVARALLRMNHEVMVVDLDHELVQKYSNEFTYAIAVDTSDTDALRQVGADQFSRAVVGIGTQIEGSVLTVLSLAELGVSEIWAKAINRKHASILERVGASHVVLPESAMGQRVAHMVTGTMTDFIEFDDGFAIARTRAPHVSAGRTLEESNLRQKYAITVVGVKRRGEDFTYARPETSISRTDELIVSGPTTKVEAFCALN